MLGESNDLGQCTDDKDLAVARHTANPLEAQASTFVTPMAAASKYRR